MKKFIIILSCILLTVGCVLDKTPKKATQDLFKKYQKLDDAVLTDLEFITEGTELTTTKQKEDYIKAMKMQYSDLKYEITDESITGDQATVTAKITVYDFYKVQKEANDYLKNHPTEFLTDEKHDKNKFIEYKIGKMLDTSDRVEYTIEIELEKEDDEWIVKSLDNETLEKIHGTYNYESE